MDCWIANLAGVGFDDDRGRGRSHKGRGLWWGPEGSAQGSNVERLRDKPLLGRVQRCGVACGSEIDIESKSRFFRWRADPKDDEQIERPYLDSDSTFS